MDSTTIAEMGQCRNCMKRRPVYETKRHGGFSYRRGDRWYNSKICEDCARSLVASAENSEHTIDRWPVRRLMRIVVEASGSDG